MKKWITSLFVAMALMLAFTTAAMAEETITEFRIGILGGENASDRLRSNECVRSQIEALLGVPTKIYAPADYNGVIEGLLGGNLDMAWLGASGYAKVYMTNPDAVEPVLVKINKDGSFGYYSVGFARVDSGIESLDDMKGKVFGFGDPNSTSGYLIPSIEIPQSGYSMKPGDYFKDVVFTGGHEQTIVAVFNGDINAGVTWADGLGEWVDGYNSGALRKAADAGLVDMTQIQEIWRSKLIPEGPIVLRKDLPEKVKLKVTGLLASMPSMDMECAYGFMAGEVKGIAPVDHDAYLSIIEARKAKSQ
ncbi:MAG: phosphonate ABC transporter substrate-binding protein [Desulfotignum sp.]|nr:phosphonate ABC transporter substrate-binding protein [Desulfotignum sp.]MCF8086771.1 phosphonate ABC transporter substrate-binding protein [Desulfotignum sp.]MCF8138585.1 phosphonate ABC transporter substrate-binding protein [Desulfotignum sp.]